jgi:deoxyribonucleoside regulator
LPVPAIVGERLTREVLEKDRIVADVLRIARSAEVLAFSLGIVGEGSVLMRSGNILKSEMAGLMRAGAVGDMLGHFIDRRGDIVDQELDARTIGLSLGDLRRCDRVIGIAAGPEKHDVSLGALRTGLINVLIADEATALFALEHAHDR